MKFSDTHSDFLSVSFFERFFVPILVVLVLGAAFVFAGNGQAIPTVVVTSTLSLGEGVTGVTGLSASDLYGFSIDSLGDIDGNGVNDFVVGAYQDETATGGSASGAVYIHLLDTDGSSLSVIKMGHGTTNGPTGLDGGDNYGYSVQNIGDIDGNGVDDLAVGARYDEAGGTNTVGAVHIHLLDTDGSVLSSVKIGEGTTNGPTGLQASDSYGASLANIGDIDDNGVDDLAVGAIFDEAGATSDTGAVFVHLLDTDGTVLSTVKIGEGSAGASNFDGSDLYGTAIIGLGDLDGNGVEDIAVSAKQDDVTGLTPYSGSVRIHFLDSDGTVLDTERIGSGFLEFVDQYGSSLENLGDLDGDGRNEIAVGAISDAAGDTSTTGAVYIHFLNTDGTISSSVKLGEGTEGVTGLNTSDNYGHSLVNLGDVDGNGVNDLGVGALDDEDGATSGTGALYIHLLDTDGTVLATEKFGNDALDGVTLAASDDYGSALASLGDVDGDGFPDVVVGASLGQISTTSNTGAVYVHFLNYFLNDPPILSSITTTNDNGVYGLNQSITIQLHFDVSLASGSATILLNTGDSVECSSVSGNFLICEYLIGSGKYAADLTVSSITELDIVSSDGDITSSTSLPTLNNLGDLSDIVVDSVARGVDGFIALQEFGEGTTGVTGLGAADKYANAIALLGDIDGNGFNDIAVGAEIDEAGASTDSGAVYIHLLGSGGSVLSTQKLGEGTPGVTYLDSGYENYGHALANMGDIDGNGVNDLAVSAYYDHIGSEIDSGAVYIHFLDTDGSVLSTTVLGEGTPGVTNLDSYDQYGVSLANLGDIDGNGVDDIVVGADIDEAGAASEAGAVYIHFLDTDGSVVSGVKIGEDTTNGPEGLDANDFYGRVLISMGDIDGNGVNDLAVSAEGDEFGSTSGTGAVHIHLLDTDGSILSSVKLGEDTTGLSGLSTSDNYGSSLALLSDIDGNGVNDLAVGAQVDEAGATSNTGVVYIHLLDTDGSVMSTVQLGEGTTGVSGLSSSDQYGCNVSSVSDYDGNGVDDLLVAACYDEMSVSNSGALYVHYLDTDGTVLSTQKIGDETTDASFDSFDRYGDSLLVIGDVDGNGYDDFALGSVSADAGATSSTGALTIFGTLKNTSIASADISGITLTLRYAQALNTAAVPDTSDYVVYSGGSTLTINSVSVVGSTVVLTLASSVFGEDAVFVDYVPGSTPVENASNIDVDQLTRYPVDNLDGGLYSLSSSGVRRSYPDRVIRSIARNSTNPLLEGLYVDFDTLYFVYSDLLNPDSLPISDSFTFISTHDDTIFEHAVVPAFVDDSIMVALVEPPVLPDSSVSLSYSTRKAGDPIENIELRNVASFIDKEVINVTEDPSFDLTRPQFLSASTPDPFTVNLRFDEPLDPDFVPRGNDFKVISESHTSAVGEVMVFDSVVTLRLFTPLFDPSLFTVVYTPDEVSLQDLKGNSVKGFSMSQ